MHFIGKAAAVNCKDLNEMDLFLTALERGRLDFKVKKSMRYGWNCHNQKIMRGPGSGNVILGIAGWR
jgi:hypothetical protein